MSEITPGSKNPFTAKNDTPTIGAPERYDHNYHITELMNTELHPGK